MGGRCFLVGQAPAQVLHLLSYGYSCTDDRRGRRLRAGCCRERATAPACAVVLSCVVHLACLSHTAVEIPGHPLALSGAPSVELRLQLHRRRRRRLGLHLLSYGSSCTDDDDDDLDGAGDGIAAVESRSAV